MFGRIGQRREKHIAVEHLSAYLDGQVTAQERLQVEQHLAACAACAHELETLRYTTQLLRTVPPVSVPRAFTLAEAEVGRAAVRRQITWLARTLQGTAALVAALLLAVLVGDILWQPGRFAAPQPMVAEKAVQETIVVEAAPEVKEETAVAEKVVEVEKPVEVQKAVAATVAVEREAVVERAAPPAPSAEAAIAEAEGAPAGEAPAELPMRAMAVTAEETPPSLEAPPGAGVGGGAVEPALEAWTAPETVEEAAPAAMAESVSPAPTVAPAETATLPAYTPTAVPVPQAAPPPPAETTARPGARWSLTRLLEIILATLLVILLGLTLWLRRWR
ncbi:MAG: zf-HC2 domain-containing protein [Anaerolineae bacterium]|nr:zf-HC2 domain-containing protein [Anaerolineae bacterium]